MVQSCIWSRERGGLKIQHHPVGRTADLHCGRLSCRSTNWTHSLTRGRPTDPLTHSLAVDLHRANRLTRPLAHSPTHSHTSHSSHSPTHPLTHPLTHTHNHTLTHSHTHTLTHSHTHTHSLSLTHTHTTHHTLFRSPVRSLTHHGPASWSLSCRSGI